MALSVEEVRDALRTGDEPIRHQAVMKLDLVADGAMELLVLAMADESWRVRRQAVERVGQKVIEPERLVDVLVPLLGEPDNVGLRNAAIEAVVGQGRVAAPAVEAAIANRPEHRKVLADVLGRIAAPTSADVLVPLLDDVDNNVQIAAAEALGRIPTQASSVNVALATRIGKVVAAAPTAASELYLSALLEAIARRRGRLAPALVRSLLQHEVVGVATLRALGSGAAPSEVHERAEERAAVLPELESNVRVRRESALLALAALLPDAIDGDVTLTPAARAGATEALLEATVEVQRAAAAVLGASDSPDAVRPLLVAANDSSLAEAVEAALVRVARRDLPGLLAIAVSMVGDARAAGYRVLTQIAPLVDGAEAEMLLRALSADVSADAPEVALAAIGAVGALGRGDGAATLAEALGKAYAQRDELESAWDRIDAIQRALALLAEKDRETVVALLRAHRSAPEFLPLVGRIGDEGDVAALVDRLRDPDGEVRRAASEALAQLVGRHAVQLDAAQLALVSDAARDLLVDESAPVRAAAVYALAAVEGRGRGVAAQAIDGLLRAARDEDVRVRGAAARALVELASRVSVELAVVLHGGLRQLADGQDPLTNVPALEALLQANDPSDDVRLLDALTGSDDERRKVALHGLVTRPQVVLRGNVLRIVERALHDTRWDLRRAAAAALAAVGDAGRAALVARRTIEEDPLVRADLDRALGGKGRRA